MEISSTNIQSDQTKATRNWFKVLVVLFVVIIVVGLLIFGALRYLYAESQKSDSLIGKAWIDLRTTPDSDSDQDGLSNADEKSYATNFWEADTDQDGFSDGQEVQNGYNPAGDGRLDDKKVSLDLDSLGL